MIIYVTDCFIIMAMCTYADVRIHANPSTSCVSDAEITSIIASAENYVLRKARTNDTTNPNLIEAVIHQAAAITLKRARAKGELASSVETPESKISITGIIEEIKQHEEDRDYFISAYFESTPVYSFSSPTDNISFNSCDRGY